MTALRVAQIMAGARHGGAELFFERLCLGLHRAGDEVLPVIRRDRVRAGRLTAAGLAPRQLGFGGALDLLTRPRLARAVRRFAPRVAVAWMGRAASYAPVGDWVLAGRLGGRYDLRRFQRCDHLIGNTAGLVDWMVRQGVEPSRVHHLPNFVPDLLGARPARLPAPPGAPVVLALGRLHRNKAFDVLIRALARLPGVHAVIAGEGPERGALAALAAAERVADRVHLPGWTTEIGGLLAAADLLACPSRIEPLGNVVIEAFSAGRPVVAAAADGPRELIRHGRDGLLCPVEDAGTLAEAIGELLEDPARAAGLAAAGRARFLAEYAEAPVLAQWRGFLARVGGGG